MGWPTRLKSSSYCVGQSARCCCCKGKRSGVRPAKLSRSLNPRIQQPRESQSAQNLHPSVILAGLGRRAAADWQRMSTPRSRARGRGPGHKAGGQLKLQILKSARGHQGKDLPQVKLWFGLVARGRLQAALHETSGCTVSCSEETRKQTRRNIASTKSAHLRNMHTGFPRNPLQEAAKLGIQPLRHRHSRPARQDCGKWDVCQNGGNWVPLSNSLHRPESVTPTLPFSPNQALLVRIPQRGAENHPTVQPGIAPPPRSAIRALGKRPQNERRKHKFARARTRTNDQAKSGHHLLRKPIRQAPRGSWQPGSGQTSAHPCSCKGWLAPNLAP